MFSTTASRLPEADIFNINDFTLTDARYTVQTDFDESLYVRKDGGVLTGNLFIAGDAKIIFQTSGTEQSFAFDETNFNKINVTDSKLSNIENIDGTTIISGDVSITGSLSVPNNSLTYSKISGLAGELGGIQTAITAFDASLNESVTDIQNIKSLNTTQSATISQLETDVSSIQTLNTAQSSSISQLETDVSAINSSIETIDTTLLSHSSALTTHSNEVELIEASATLLTGRVSTLETSVSSAVANIATLQQDIFNLNDTVPTNTNFSELNNKVSTLQTDVSLNKVQIGLIDVSLTSISGSINSINSDLSTKASSISSLNTSVSNINSALNVVNISIGNLDETVSSQGISINTLSNENITLTNELALKQDIINESNLLDVSYIGAGTITNAQLETLTGIQTNQTIQYQIDAIKTSLTSLTGLQNIDITDIDALQADNTSNKNRLTSLETAGSTQNTINTSVQGQITTIQSSISTLTGDQNDLSISLTDSMALKNDIIDVNNKLSSNYVLYGEASLTDALDTLNSSLSNLQNADLSSNSDIVALYASADASVVYQNTNDTNIATINSSLNDRIAYETSNDLSLNGIKSAITALQSYTVSNDSDIVSLNSAIGIIDASVNNITLSITDLENSKQDNLSLINKLSVSFIDLESSALSHVDITTPLQATINGLTNTDTSFTNSIITINTNLTALTNADTLHDSQISAIQSSLSALQTNKMDIIGASNKVSSLYVSTGASQVLSDKLTLIDASLSSLETNKQSLLNNSTNKLSIDKVDLTGSSLMYCDVSSSIASSLQSINNSISTLTGLQSSDLTTFQAIQDNFDLIDTQLSNKQTIITTDSRLNASLVGDGSVSNTVWSYLQNIDADIQTQINNLQTADNAIHSISYATGVTTIADKTLVTTLEFSGDNSQQTIAFSSSKNTELTNATSAIAGIITDVAGITSDISALETDITNLQSSKMNVIDNSHKLSASLLDLSGSSLNFCDINTSLASQLTTISNNISALQTYDSNQTTTNTNLTNSINTLQTQKNDLIDDSNKVSSLYVSYGLTTVKADLDSLHSYHTTNDLAISDIQDSITSINSTKQNVLSGSNKLDVAYVNLGTSALSYVDISASLQTQLNSITNDISSLNTASGNNATAITSLQSNDTVLSGQISANSSSITSLETNKQNVIDSSHLLSSAYVSSGSGVLSDKITLIDASLSSLESSKQNLIDGNHKLAVSLIDLSGSPLYYCDVSSSLVTQFQNINDTIATLTTLQAGDATSFTSINNSISNINTSLSGKQDALGSITNKFTYLANVTSDIQTQINNMSGSGGSGVPSISYDSSDNITTIADTSLLTTLKFSGDNSVQSTAFTTAKNIALSTATSNVSTLQTDIIQLQSDLSGKQDVLNTSTNKLDIAKVNLIGSSLEHIDISSGLQSQLTTITNNISSLQSFDTSQVTLNSTFTSDILNLNSGKNDLINSGNKLSSSFVAYNATTVSAELGSINTALSAKASLADPTFTGTVSGISKSMIGLGNCDNTSDANKGISTATQSALDLKLNLTGTGSSNLSGPLHLMQIGEKLVSATHSSNVYTLDYSLGSIFYSTNLPTANFTVNIINVPTKTNFQHTVTLIYQANFYGSTASAKDTGNTTIVASSSPKFIDAIAPSFVAGSPALIYQTFNIIQCYATKYITSNVVAFA